MTSSSLMRYPAIRDTYRSSSRDRFPSSLAGSSPSPARSSPARSPQGSRRTARRWAVSGSVIGDGGAVCRLRVAVRLLGHRHSQSDQHTHRRRSKRQMRFPLREIGSHPWETNRAFAARVCAIPNSFPDLYTQSGNESDHHASRDSSTLSRTKRVTCLSDGSRWQTEGKRYSKRHERAAKIPYFTRVFARSRLRSG
jgi:hypothetical protein